MGTYKNCLEGEAHASRVQQQWLKWIVKGFSLSVRVYRYLRMSIHISVQTFLEKAWFHGLVPSALKRLLFNYVRQQLGQKSNQVINRAPVGPRAERSYSSVAFWERVKKPSRRKNTVSPSLSLFTFLGKWLMFARTLIEENPSSTILNVGLCFHCFSEEREEIKVRKHKAKISFLMKCVYESTILQGGNLSLLF